MHSSSIVNLTRHVFILLWCSDTSPANVLDYLCQLFLKQNWMDGLDAMQSSFFFLIYINSEILMTLPVLMVGASAFKSACVEENELVRYRGWCRGRMMVVVCLTVQHSSCMDTTTRQKCGPMRSLGADDHHQWQDGEWISVGFNSTGTHVTPNPCDKGDLLRCSSSPHHITVARIGVIIWIFNASLICRIYFINKNL